MTTLKDIISQCCKKDIYVVGVSKGLFCTGCNKEVFNTIDKEYYGSSTKENKNNK